MAEIELSSKEKAAILLICLGENYAAELYKHLSEDEIETLTLGITTTRRVPPEIQEEVLAEFYEICIAQKYISEGGMEYARNILNRALGMEKAESIIEKLSSTLQVRPFEFVRKADSIQILNLVSNENAQTTALLLSYLEPTKAAEVLTNLNQEIQVEVIMRMANMGSVMPEYIKEAERVLEQRLANLGLSDQTAVGGIDAVVEIINNVDRGTERGILESLDLHDADLADEIRKKMFVFEDIIKLNNQAIQRVLRDVEQADLAVALKGATEEVAGVIMSNLSKRLQDMVRDDIDVMGPVRVKDVEEAQQKIVNAVRVLEESGEIVVSRGEGGDVIV